MFGRSNPKPKDDCPWWQGPCRKHECRLYIMVTGKHPQSDAVVDRWGCSFEFMPLLLIENSQMQHQTNVEVNQLRNLTLTLHEQFVDMIVKRSQNKPAAFSSGDANDAKTIEGGRPQ